MANVSISITVPGLKDFQKAFASGSAVAKQEIAKALYTSAVAVHGKTKEFTPVLTGNLRRSITFAVGKETAVVGTNSRYAPFIEEGTKPHGPKSAKMMVFKGRSGQKVVVRNVRGVKAVHMFKRGVEVSAKTITDAFNRAVSNLFTHLKT